MIEFRGEREASNSKEARSVRSLLFCTFLTFATHIIQQKSHKVINKVIDHHKQLKFNDFIQ